MRKVVVTLTVALSLVASASVSVSAGTADADRSAGAHRVAGTAAAIKELKRKRDGTRVVSWTVSTPSLKMSSSTPLAVHVILPTSYRKHPKRRYPVLYALPGTSNKASVWLKNIHTLVLTRRLDLIVVVPDGTYDGDGGGFYTNWVDQTTSRGVANWETFHTRELVPWIDHRYRTIRARSARAIVGISQGGFGSMSYAARHPRVYGAAASFSGAVDIYHGAQCRVGASALIAGIMTGLNQVQPNAPFGDPLTNAANWRAHDPGSLVKRLTGTRVDLYTSTGAPGESDLTDPAVPGTVAMEALLHQSNLCFKDAADAVGLRYGWHSNDVGTHAWKYGDRSLRDYLPRLMRFFRSR